MEITYQTNPPLTAEQALNIYKQSGLSRPKDLQRVQAMIDHANVTIAAWHGEELVGFLRAMSDFTFDCYINDLAVHKNYQKLGIGRQLINHLTELLGDGVLVFLISSQDATSFYTKINFKGDFEKVGEPICMITG